ncbi:hypothetical protein CHARACLAT_030438 [Characodon lateralis]|uniref:Uncharacterized protein n=1 Tax=Characodon lateralis TaxID=208331 RepID=A0ABU7E917_9TELE|nr:hypothetical protein [Characodon lateralis]
MWSCGLLDQTAQNGAHGLNQSIGAPGSRAQQRLCVAQRSAALSGFLHLRLGGKLWREGKSWCSFKLVSLRSDLLVMMI